MMENEDNVFVLEVFQVAKSKGIHFSTRLDESKYNQFFNRISEAIKEEIPKAQILKNKIPKIWKNTKCQVIKNENKMNPF